MMEKLNIKFRTFEDFINEQAYDEQDAAPKASVQAKDYQVKEDLRNVTVVIEEILSKIEDGEQLEDVQVKMVKDVTDTINKLKRQIQGKERIEADKEEKKKEEQEFNNGL